MCTGEVLETLNKSFKLTINLTRNVKCLYVKPHYDYDYSTYEYKDSGFSKMLIYEDIPTIKYSDIDFGFKIIEVDMSGMKTKVLKQRIGTTEFEVGKQYRMKTKEELIAMGYKEVDGGLRYSPHCINKIMITLCDSLITIKSLSNAPVYNCSIIQSENSWHTDWFHLHDPQQKSFYRGSIKKKSKYISITKTKIESKEYKTHKPKYIKLTKIKKGFKLPSQDAYKNYKGETKNEII